MEMSEEETDDEDGSSQPSAPKRAKLDLSLSSNDTGNLREENDSLKCQLEAYKNECEVMKQEIATGRRDSLHLSTLQKAFQGMQQQLMKAMAESAQCREELKSLQQLHQQPTLAVGNPSSSDSSSSPVQACVASINGPDLDSAANYPSTSTGEQTVVSEYRATTAPVIGQDTAVVTTAPVIGQYIALVTTAPAIGQDTAVVATISVGQDPAVLAMAPVVSQDMEAVDTLSSVSQGTTVVDTPPSSIIGQDTAVVATPSVIGQDTMAAQSRVERIASSELSESCLQPSSSQHKGKRHLSKDAQLVGLISTFLHIHPFGATGDNVWAYLKRAGLSIEVSEVEALMEAYQSVFKQDTSGFGACIEKKWWFIGFKLDPESAKAEFH